MVLAMFPATAFAAGEAHWAQPAVDALNGIYGNGVFVTNDDPMTNSELNTLITATKWAATTGLDGSENLTRGKACELLADVFGLPIGEQSAIEYLYAQKIINGKADGDLDADGDVSKAEFAVLTYRVLNSVGGGLGSSNEALKPGTKEYFAWMYLAARRATEFKTTTGNDAIDEDTWNAWIAALMSENITTKPSTFDPVCPEATTTKIAAAVQIVDAYIEAGGSATIFSDVPANNPFFDGIMYLFDQGIVSGNGDGTFAPDAEMPRYQLAVLLAVLDEADCANASGLDRITGSIAYAIEKGYMMGETSTDENWNPITDDDWKATTPRQEAIVALMKQLKVNVTGVNADILGRFSDTSDIDSADQPYLAYAVSIGLVNGTADGKLEPGSGVTRGQFGMLLYRTLLGVDKTKMKDYADDVAYAKGEEAIQTFALRAARAADNTLTLRENWRLTSDLDLNVPEGETLTITGNGYHIYEMGGKLQNSGKGTVLFDKATLYPQANDTDAGDIATDGIWDATESAALMAKRQPAVAETHTHAVSVGCETDTGDQVTFTEWNTAAALPTEAGHYVLTTDITIDGEWTAPQSGETTLCLNGHTINITCGMSVSRGILVTNGAKLNICDCSAEETGAISVTTTSAATTLRTVSAICNEAYGTLNLYGGNISIESDYNCYGLALSGNSNICGGTVTATLTKIANNNYNPAVYGIHTYSSDKNISISGGVFEAKCTATGADTNEALRCYGLKVSDYNNPNLSVTGGVFIGKAGAFADTGITINATGGIFSTNPTGVIAPGGTARVITENDDGYKAAYAGYYIVEPASAQPKHTHAVSVDCSTTDGDQVEFTEWKTGDFNNTFPSAPGNYVLAGDVNVGSDTWTIGTGVYNLCLNGHTLKMNNGMILLNGEGTLNICDCSEEGSGLIENIHDRTEEGIDITNSKATFNLYGGNIYIESTSAFSTYTYGVSASSAYINIYGGSITAKASDAKAAALYISSDTPKVKIYGGIMTADAPEGKEEYGLYLPSLYSGWNSYSIEGGVFIGRNSLGIGDATNAIKVTGGIFSTDPTGVIDPSYTARVITADDEGYQPEYAGYYVVEPASAHTHSYTYATSGATITESCTCGHSAEAVISVPQQSYTHTGQAITPATVSYSGSWAGGTLTPAYENNTDVGVATAKITIGGAAASVTFNITAAAPSSYTVTFNMNGHGTAIDPLTVNSGEKVTKPADPIATGYTFGGWYKEPACENEWVFDTDTVTAATTLYAKWTAETYSVTLNAGGAIINSNDVTSYTYGVGATLPTQADMTKTDYRFDGWYESADFSGSPVTTISATDIGNKTYYAKWTEMRTASGTITGFENTTYTGKPTATLVALGGKTETATVTPDDGNGPWTYSATVPAGQYNLVVTATESGEGGKTVTVTSLVDLTAQDASRDFTLPTSTKSSTVKASDDSTPKVIAGGVDEIAKNTDIPADASTITIELTVDEKEEGYVSQDAAKIESVANGQTIDLYLDIQLQLFKDNETTGTDLGSTNDQILELLVPTDTSKTGLTVYRVHDGKAEALKKDSADANGEYFTVGNGFVTIYAKKFSIYAIGYTPDNTYTITLDANGGTVNGGSTATLITGTDKKLSSLPTPTRSGSYTFDGWFTAASGGTKVTTETVFTSNQTIYAHWTYTGSTDSGGSYTPTYSITVEKTENGKVEANRSYASSGSTVTLTVAPEDGYVLDGLTVTDSQGNNIEVVDKGDSTYTFKMPSRAVTVEAVFVSDGGFSTCTGGSTCPIYPYTDADPAAWYHDGVHYCIEHGLMVGYGDNIFKPDASTTRAMLTVMLWRLNGSPVVNYALDFEDVAEGQWYTEAIRWAVSEGIATGYGNGYFGTNDAITREQLAAMLWRHAGSPESSQSLDHFGDAIAVSGYAVEALAWANEQGIVVGVGNNTLSPQSHATRAQVATMLMRMVQATTK